MSEENNIGEEAELIHKVVPFPYSEILELKKLKEALASFRKNSPELDELRSQLIKNEISPPPITTTYDDFEVIKKSIDNLEGEFYWDENSDLLELERIRFEIIKKLNQGENNNLFKPLYELNEKIADLKITENEKKPRRRYNWMD